MFKLSDYFNSTTNKGRANVAKATYASLAALYLYSRFRKWGKDKPVNADNSNGDERNGFLDVKECPQCKCSKETATGDVQTGDQQDWHESSKPNTNASEPDKPSTDQDDFVAAAESFIKSSQAKYEDGDSRYCENIVNFYSEFSPADY